MDPNDLEKKLSKVMCLLEELDGKEIDESYWDGYHPEIYNKNVSRAQGNRLVSELCKRLQSVKNITKYSLELQMWWRDHKAADKARLKEELEEAKSKQARVIAMAKLTPYEKEILGLE